MMEGKKKGRATEQVGRERGLSLRRDPSFKIISGRGDLDLSDYTILQFDSCI